MTLPPVERVLVLRIVTHNVNGIRAAARRGYPAWLEGCGADVICLQEVRATAADIPAEATGDYHLAYHPGDRAGRNGVALLTRREPEEVRIGFESDEFDRSGRYIEADLPGVTVASLYLPNGATEGEKYHEKMRFMAEFADYLRRAIVRHAAAGREFVVCGDYNIAHTELDIKAWKTNLKSKGFLPEERAWYGQQVDDGPLVDVLRALHPGVAGPYSWWSWRGKAFDNDAGWRIDHHWATPALAARAASATVQRAPSYAERISDHAPVVVDYDV